MLQDDFKEECISGSQCGRWHKASKEGREMVTDEPCSGRPTTARPDENDQHVREVLKSDSRLSIQVIANTLNLSKCRVHGIMTEDLQMRKVCAKLVLKMLTEEQKEVRVLSSEELMELMSCCPSLPIALTWCLVTFSCSPD
ncbi:protein GVQW3 [Parasteatoda tepidariorum]|uniref:protein GVQW3 n=1 Tax=Parasteatoda tepidariorum TaxID=114398 RepID=UPI001C719E90|nr:protein GVQW3-like [Parasteatoda tepidariorum]